MITPNSDLSPEPQIPISCCFWIFPPQYTIVKTQHVQKWAFRLFLKSIPSFNSLFWLTVQQPLRHTKSLAIITVHQSSSSLIEFYSKCFQVYFRNSIPINSIQIQVIISQYDRFSNPTTLTLPQSHLLYCCQNDHSKMKILSQPAPSYVRPFHGYYP